MNKVFLLFIFFIGCSNIQNKEELTKKYRVVSSFNEVVFLTDDKAEAYEKAHNLTLMGRIFSSKPCYFVLENK